MRRRRSGRLGWWMGLPQPTMAELCRMAALCVVLPLALAGVISLAAALTGN